MLGQNWKIFYYLFTIELNEIVLGPIHLRRRHFYEGGVSRVQILPNFPTDTDSSKKMSTEGGRGQKSWKFADVLNGWSLITKYGYLLGTEKQKK